MPGSMIAAQLYTLRASLKTPEDIAQTLPKVREVGYEAVQLSGLGPIGKKELKKLLDENGLTCCATHEPYERLVKEPEAVAEEHAILECRYTACPALSKEMRNEAGFHEAAKTLSDAGKKLAEAGVTLTYHNHSFEFARFDGRLGLEIIYDESDPQFLQGEIDTYWVQHGGGSPAAWCRRLKHRLPLVHLKDMGIIDGKQTYVEIGEGNLDWPDILAACRESGTGWYIVELDTCPREPLESLRISIENLRKMGLQ